MRLLIVFLLQASVFANAPENWQIGLQKPSTALMQELSDFHDLLLQIISVIVICVFVSIAYICVRYSKKNNPEPLKFKDNVLLEVVWTLIPCIILVVIAIPSFKALRTAENIPKHDLTIKVVAYQWYWHYEYFSYENLSFDSHMIPSDKIMSSQRKFLSVDNPIYIPQGAIVKFLITSADVIHSFALPSAGIKVDAIPGRANQAWVKIEKLGTYYGQCSELCGVGHALMPIEVRVVPRDEFDNWVKRQN